MIIKVTDAMKMASEAWPEGWVKVRLREIQAEPSANKDSINLFPIYYDPTNGKELSKYAGMMNNKNETMFGTAFIPLVTALLNREVASGEELDHEKFKEIDLWIELRKEPYKGKMNDKVIGYASKDNVPF